MNFAPSVDDGELPATVFKVTDSDKVGVLIRNSNTSVTIRLASSLPFTLTMKYNSKIVGTTYVFPAVQYAPARARCLAAATGLVVSV